MSNVSKKNIGKILLLIGSIIFIYIIFQSEGFSILRTGDLDSFQDYLDENLSSALLFMFLFMIIQNSISIIPLILLVTVNILVFGFLFGFFWSWFTSIIGCLLVFIIVRYWLHDMMIDKLNDDLKRKIENSGFMFVFIMRIFPILPTNIINIAAGVSSIKVKTYLLGTMFGNLIYIFALSLIQLGIMTEETEHYLLIFISLLLIVLIFVIRKKRKNKKVSIKLQNNEVSGEK